MNPVAPYKPQHKVRLVTSASLFDGHDAAINIMRRIMQSTGAEVIHLGHNRSVQEIVDCAIQEDVQGIAITSYQGGHVEFFKYMHDLLKERGAGHIKIFGGGGGTILPEEIAELHEYGINRIYSPDDGREMGLQGMINDVIKHCDYSNSNSIHPESVANLPKKNAALVGRVITIVENDPETGKAFMQEVEKLQPKDRVIPILGITGTGGAGKSSLTDELVRRFLLDFSDKSIAVLSVDPSKRRTGGALLGDRIRMNAIFNGRVYMRSMATRAANVSMSQTVKDAVKIFRAAAYDLIIIETAGIGQSDTEITEVADVALYVMTPEYGAATQLEKIDMLDFADLISINKFDKRGALDALRDVKKQFQRNHNRWETPTDQMPAFGTIASQFNDPGTNRLYKEIMKVIEEKTAAGLNSTYEASDEMSEKIFIIPPERVRYLAEIAEENDRYEKWVKEQTSVARKVFALENTLAQLEGENEAEMTDKLSQMREDIHRRLAPENQDVLKDWDAKRARYKTEYFTFSVRNKEIKIANYSTSLSQTQIPKICLPSYQDYGEILRWVLRENVPGEFPFTAGVYAFKRTGEDPTRMFAGEGGPERTNKRFHYVSLGMPAARLSTAFDSVTLYGENPDYRPDIYGKIGNSGVSIASLDDAKRLYSGFDLCK
ncbi:MAG TPA: hypothetical protein ENJ82_07895, partial [Bacteroidetes bacterium]|nr:hypothetical protein [Bacteroidota bacterium]